MTPSAVEARSLSSLTTLASNPPSYPRNPTHVKHEPLVLYIARVPGSRDVFLTPMKPRDRVVTAEDVQSSLYYLHFDQPEDADLVAPEVTRTGPAGYDANSNSNEPRPPSIPRKPIPNSLPSQRPLASSHLLPELPPRIPNAPRQNPVAAGLSTRSNVNNSQNIAAGNYLQPLPHSLPPYDRGFSVDSIQQGKEPPPPPLPPRQSLDTHQLRSRSEDISHQVYHNNGTSSGGQSPGSPSFPRPPSARSEEPGVTSVIVIRRDPASGAQWNVARIEDPPVPEISSNAIKDPTSARKNKTGAPMYIEVLNPGYSKFLGLPERPTSLLSRPSDLSTMSENHSNFNPMPAEERPPVGDRVFRRRLWMEGTKYPDNNFGHRKMGSHDSAIGPDVLPSRNDGWATEQVRKNTSVDPHFLTPDDRSSSIISNKSSGFRGYVFQSPWNGRCEFSTGSGGSSLKCKHFLPGFQGGLPAPPATVSELRFNLPGGVVGSSTPRGDQPKRSSLFHRPRHNRNHSATTNIREGGAEDARSSLDRLDLSLGQEFAGGGFGGRQAKLGKLIIEDEGLKMVDMLVAANLALWWRVYDKVDVRTRGRSASFQA